MARALRSLLSSVDPGRDPTAVSCRPISGGYSRVTDGGRGAVGRRRGGAARSCAPTRRAARACSTASATGSGRCCRRLAKVDTIVIPEPRWYDGTGEHFGTKCIVMDHCEGMPLQLTLPGLDDFGPATDVYLEVAAAIHAHAARRACRPTSSARPTGTATSTRAIDIYERRPSASWPTAARSSATCARGCGPTSRRPCRSRSCTATSSRATSSSPTGARR